LSRRKSKIDKKTRRILEQTGEASGFRYVADRAEIVRDAKALADDLGIEDLDVFSLIELASFLAGDDTKED
jgi:hypothetical protein